MKNDTRPIRKQLPSLIRLSRSATIFFCIAPIYWLPAINQGLVSGIKTFAALYCLFSLSLCMSAIANTVKGDAVFANLIVVLVASLIYVGTFYNDFSFGPLTITLYISIFFVVGHTLGAKNTPLIKIDKYTLPFIVLFLAMCTWVVFALIIPSFDTPNTLYNDLANTTDYIYFELPYLSSTGLNFGRTGWSLSVFLLILCLLHATQYGRQSYGKLIVRIALLVGVLSIFTTGSRGGLLYLIICMTLFVLNGPQRLRLTFKALAITLLAISIGLVYYFFGHNLRLSGIDDFSTGRLDGYAFSFVLLAQNFLWGAYPNGGYTLIENGLQYDQIHNAWLNIIASYGIVFSCIFFLFFLIVLKQALKASREYFYLRCVLVVGLISTFLEPQTIFSNGHHILVYWGVLGYLNSRIKLLPQQHKA